MMFVRTFKGYEDKTGEMDRSVNNWVSSAGVKVVDIKVSLSHEPNARSGSGDLIYTVIYEADAPVG